MKVVKIKLKDAEKVKKELLKSGNLDLDYKPAKDKENIYYAVNKEIKGYMLVNRELEKRESKNNKDYLKEKLSEDEILKINNSFDIIGNIAVIEVDKELEDKEEIIADSILKFNKNIKTVVKKVGGHEGVYRIQKYEMLKGNKNLETLYKENGLRFKLDISKVYFSPRLSNERMRIARLIKEGEKVLVMFSGIGVYQIVISKYSKAKEVYGVEINPEACKYAEENVRLNKIKNIKLYCGDVNEVVPGINKKFDRIIMPLPKESRKFLGLARKYLEKNGIIHLYFFSKEDELENVLTELKKEYKILNVVKCGQSSPREFRYCTDMLLL